jgi:hypothetical protein
LKEKLIIKNFGPIKSVELELGRFNVLIGEQATGKSTVAKVLAVCRYFSYIALDNPGENDESRFSAGLTAWGLNEAVKNDSYIFYECKHYALTVEQKLKPWITGSPGKKGKYNLNIFLPSLRPISQEFKDLLSELYKIWRPVKTAIGGIENRIPTSFFQNDVATVLDNPLYIFTERGLQSLFSLGKSSIPNISDSLYNYFDKSTFIISNNFKTETNIDPLDIVYKNENGRGYIKNSNHDFLSLSNAAGGYQSTTPIVLLTKYYSEIKKRKKLSLLKSRK